MNRTKRGVNKIFIAVLAILILMSLVSVSNATEKEVPREKYEISGKIDVENVLRTDQLNHTDAGRKGITYSIQVASRNLKGIQSGDYITIKTKNINLGNFEENIKDESGITIGKVIAFKAPMLWKDKLVVDRSKEMANRLKDGNSIATDGEYRIVFNENIKRMESINLNLDFIYSLYASRANHDRTEALKLLDVNGRILDSKNIKIQNSTKKNKTTGSIKGKTQPKVFFDNYVGRNFLKSTLSINTVDTTFNNKIFVKGSKIKYILLKSDFCKPNMETLINPETKKRLNVGDVIDFNNKGENLITEGLSKVSVNGFYYGTFSEGAVKVIEITDDSVTYEITKDIKNVGGILLNMAVLDWNIKKLPEENFDKSGVMIKSPKFRVEFNSVNPELIKANNYKNAYEDDSFFSNIFHSGNVKITKSKYKITTAVEGGIGGTITDGKIVEYGDNFSYEIKADEGYEVEYIKVDGKNVDKPVELKEIDDRHDIIVKYRRIVIPEAKKSIIDDNMIPKKVIENKVETSNEENKLKGETEEKTIQTPVKTEEKKKMIISDSPKTGDLLSLEIFLVVFLGSVIGLIIVRKINHGKIFW